ncbi:hypothetical protein JTB14_037913 [Gonioctena quinquepunctata]|nr:hypothetical protein JTB14_001540 [Gonioctena quinquepunctata]KAG5885121.1 hypothetical protein JTB14_037913 [Gonioctena quinquepunctata]
MNSLAVAILFVAVAYTSASGIGLVQTSIKGDLEGALGGQWIPDVPVAAPGIGLGVPALGLGVPALGLGVPALGLGVPALGLGAAGLGLGAGIGGIGVSRGAVEGALGGQWIPDTHGK